MSGITRWGPPTWIFFHTFAAKINKTFFPEDLLKLMEQNADYYFGKN